MNTKNVFSKQLFLQIDLNNMYSPNMVPGSHVGVSTIPYKEEQCKKSKKIENNFFQFLKI